MLLPFLLGASTPTSMIERVYRWQPLVEEECPNEDPLLILSMIAQESGGNPKAIREEGEDLASVGLMQIMTFWWRPPKSWLMIPENNVQYGCRILDQIEGDIRYKLAVYNCGEVGVEANKCGAYGGYAYADRILNYWYPRFVMYQRSLEPNSLTMEYLREELRWSQRLEVLLHPERCVTW
jgi:soluble lytic murein transglycosylase-like protein